MAKQKELYLITYSLLFSMKMQPVLASSETYARKKFKRKYPHLEITKCKLAEYQQDLVLINAAL